MAYVFEDRDKKQVDGPSITGWTNVVRLTNEYKGVYPAIEELIKFGYTNKLLALGQNCRMLAAKTKDESVKGTLQALAKFTHTAKEIIFLHDGVQ